MLASYPENSVLVTVLRDHFFLGLLLKTQEVKVKSSSLFILCTDMGPNCEL